MGYFDIHKPIASASDPVILTYPVAYTVTTATLEIQARLNGLAIAPAGLSLTIYDARNTAVHASALPQDSLSPDRYDALNIDVSELPNGVYAYAFEDASGVPLASAQFCVLGQASIRIALLHPFFTWHAYCAHGGESFYKGQQFDDTRVIELDLNRPLQGLSRCHDPASLRNLSALLDQNDLDHSNFCSLHFHQNPDCLDDVDLLILAGHDEYWTHNQFDALEGFIKRGGHVANFSANVLCWAIDIEGETIRVDKRNIYEPGVSHARSSGQFRSAWINRPQQRLFGLNYFSAGYPAKRIPKSRACVVISEAVYDASDQIKVLAPEHRVFKDIAIEDGVLQTSEARLLDVEVDGVFLKEGEVDRLRTVDVARETHVLAKALVNVAYSRPDRLGRLNSDLWFEDVGIMTECVPFEGGGTTSQIGSVGWYKAAEHPGSNEARLTTNIIHYLLEKQP
ncbi:MAG: N,N-dimethylformamidase beta subunit family domain-containing protein [Pseudomonadota bacterium]